MVSKHGVEMDHISFHIGDFAIENFSLAVRKGEYFVLTGPNGAGKSVLIKLIAGLFQPDAGTIRIDGRNVTDLPPWQRNIGYVPQDGILFPNRSVRENVRFGLEVRHVKKSVMDCEVERIASMCRVRHLLDRTPRALSGGERQKVSLARALVLKSDVLLLDEPVSAIDEEARDSMCGELRRVQRRLGVSIIHVSHSQKESELVANRMGAMKAGKLATITEFNAADKERCESA